MLGHSDSRTTLDIYAHLMEGSHIEAAKKINKLFTP